MFFACSKNGEQRNFNLHFQQFYHRSPFCTYALGKHFDHWKNIEFTLSPVLLDEIDRCLKNGYTEMPFDDPEHHESDPNDVPVGKVL